MKHGHMGSRVTAAASVSRATGEQLIRRSVVVFRQMNDSVGSMDSSLLHPRAGMPYTWHGLLWRVQRNLCRGAPPEDVNRTDPATGEPPLHIALQSRAYKSVDALLRYGARVDVVDARGLDALHAAVRMPHCNPTMLRLLFAAGVHATSCHEGVTPLEVILRHGPRRGKTDNVRAFLDAVPVEERYALVSPITAADMVWVKRCLPRLHDLLAEYVPSSRHCTAEIRRDSRGRRVVVVPPPPAPRTPTQEFAFAAWHTSAFHGRTAAEVHDELDAWAAKGVDFAMLSVVDGGCNGSALHWAAWHSNDDLVRELIARGADVNARARDTGGSVLLWALRNGSDAVVLTLLNAGADVMAVNDYGLAVMDALLARYGENGIWQRVVVPA